MTIWVKHCWPHTFYKGFCNKRMWDISTKRVENYANCSRKNFVFLFGALINLTVMIDAYFHPMRMTYPIQPRPFFRAAPNWEKSAKLSLPQNRSKRTDVLSVCSLHSSSITTPWGKPSNLWTSWVYSLRTRVPSWIWIRCMESATHRNTFMSPPTFAILTATRNYAQTSSYFIPGQHFLETFIASLLQQPGPHIYGWLHHSCP